MPLELDYISAEELKTAVSRKDDIADDDAQRAVSAASRAIDLLTGRKFGKTDTEETRKFTAMSGRFVSIRDMVSIETVKSDGLELSEDDWTGFPLNADLDNRPFTGLESNGMFTKKIAGIEITGIYGWPSVPAEVEQFTMILASKFFKRTRDAPWGIVSTGGIDGLMVRLAREDPDLMMLVTQLIRPETVDF